MGRYFATADIVRDLRLRGLHELSAAQLLVRYANPALPPSDRASATKRIVVLADGDFLSNQFIGNGGNLDLVTSGALGSLRYKVTFKGPGGHSWGAFGKATELRQRILFTVGLLMIYRLGTYIPVPGIDGAALRTFMESAGTGIGGMDTIGERVVPLTDAGRTRRLGGTSVEQVMTSGISARVAGLLALGNQVTTNSSA